MCNQSNVKKKCVTFLGVIFFSVLVFFYFQVDETRKWLANYGIEQYCSVGIFRIQLIAIGINSSGKPNVQEQYFSVEIC